MKENIPRTSGSVGKGNFLPVKIGPRYCTPTSPGNHKLGPAGRTTYPGEDAFPKAGTGLKRYNR